MFHQIMSKIFCRLRALGRLPSFVGKALYLNDTSLGNLTWGWLATLYLGFSIEPEVRVSGTLVLKLAIADNPWSEVLAEIVQNVFEGTVIRSFLGRPTGPTYLGHANKIFADIISSCRFDHVQVCRDLRL